MEYYSAIKRNEFESVLMRWISLESIIQTEVSQKEKAKYHILTCLVKAIVFPVVMYGCESWTIKNAKCQRINAFELWCWRRLLSLLDCKEIKPVHPKGNQS